MDTNVFISGLFWKGPPSKIIELWTAQAFEVVVSPKILTEYELVLRRFDKKLPWDQLNRNLPTRLGAEPIFIMTKN